MKKWVIIGIIIFCVSSILIISFEYQKIQKLKQEKNISQYNLDALNDTIKIVKNKAGQIEFEKESFISKAKDLEKLNSDLADQLKKEKGKVIYIESANTNVDNSNSEKINTIPNFINVYNKDSSSIDTKFDTSYDLNNYRRLYINTIIKFDSSKIKYSSSKILRDQFGFNIVTGLKETENNKLRIMIRSDYPGLSFNKIEGDLIDPQNSNILKKFFPPKRFGFGPIIGYGLTYNQSYGVKFGIFAGVGIQYNIIRW